MATRILVAFLATFLALAAGQPLNCDKSATVKGNAGGEACTFPFVYLGESYNECTDKNHDKLWCATVANYDRRARWGECICSVQNPGSSGPTCIETTESGANCSESWFYKRKKYNGCSTKDNFGTPWCSLTDNYDNDGKWENCASPLKCQTSQTGTGCREQTVFSEACAPTFLYQGVNYTGCTTVDNGNTPWCSLTPDYDADAQYSNCKVPLRCINSGGAGPGCQEETTFGAKCAPWFIYGGMNYTGCTKQDYATYWCSLTTNYDRGQQWGDCATPLKCAPPVTDGDCTERTLEGANCAFKYIYLEKEYYGCTTFNYDKSWCSLTPNYDRDKQFGVCETPLKCTTNPNNQ